jgi:hypothetical protein
VGTDTGSVRRVPPAADPRLVLVFDEARRAITQQLARFGEIRSRAGTLFSAASVVASLLGGVDLRGSERPSFWTWTGIALYICVTLLVFALSWPLTVTFENDAQTMLDSYVLPGASVDEMHQEIAGHMARHFRENKKKLDRLTTMYQVLVVAVGAEVLALVIDLNGRA